MFLFLIITFFSCESDDFQESDPCTIAGVVVDKITKQPLQDVTLTVAIRKVVGDCWGIMCTYQYPAISTTNSDDDGNFDFQSIDCGLSSHYFIQDISSEEYSAFRVNVSDVRNKPVVVELFNEHTLEISYDDDDPSTFESIRYMFYEDGNRLQSHFYNLNHILYPRKLVVVPAGVDLTYSYSITSDDENYDFEHVPISAEELAANKKIILSKN